MLGLLGVGWSPRGWEGLRSLNFMVALSCWSAGVWRNFYYTPTVKSRFGAARQSDWDLWAIFVGWLSEHRQECLCYQESPPAFGGQRLRMRRSVAIWPAW